MFENDAKQRIDFISSLMECPEHLCKEDWDVWRLVIVRSCAAVNGEYKNKGIEAINFFDLHFHVTV